MFEPNQEEYKYELLIDLIAEMIEGYLVKESTSE